MNELIIRDPVRNDRLARGLADYYSRRQRGVHCRDPLEPLERATVDWLRSRQLQSARQFVAHVRQSPGA
jgi:hypothetical protein